MKSGYKIAIVTAVVLLVVIFAYYLKIEKPQRAPAETPDVTTITSNDSAITNLPPATDNSTTTVGLPPSTDDIAARMRTQSTPPTDGTTSQLVLGETPTTRPSTEAVDAFPPTTRPVDNAAGTELRTSGTDLRPVDTQTPERTVDLFSNDTDDAAASSASSTYTIKAGDTFQSIAAKHLGSASRWRDIGKANPFVEPTKLKIGQVIKLPGATGAVSDASVEPPRRVAARATDSAVTTVKPRGITHKVKFGETLSTLAYQYYGDRGQWKKIYNANRDVLRNPDRLPDGVKLTIPAKSSR